MLNERINDKNRYCKLEMMRNDKIILVSSIHWFILGWYSNGTITVTKEN
jgi:hypothetical protein